METLKAIPAPFTKGVNITNWLEFKTADQIHPEAITKQDFINVKSLGCDVVRLPIHFEKICEGSRDLAIPEKIFRILDEVAAWAEELKLYVIFDFHNATQVGTATSEDVENVLTPIWRQVATHYQNASNYIIYELMNEPHGIEIPKWNEIIARVFQMVRGIDPQHYIIVGGADWNSFRAMKTLPDFKDDKVIFTFHYYDPHTFTHQGASWSKLDRVVGIPFPYEKDRMPKLPEQASEEERERFESYPEQGTIERMKPFFDQYAEFSQQRKVPIFCGEFGCYALAAPKQDRVTWYKVVTALLEERGISRTSWDYFGGFGLYKWLSPEKRFMKPSFPDDLDMDIVDALGLSLNK